MLLTYKITKNISLT